MQVKKFVAPTVKEATIKMKSELGENAIVLSTRVINGANNLKYFEVTAGVEEEYDKIQKKAAPKPEPVKKQEKLKNSLQDELLKLASKVYGSNEENKPEVKPQAVRQERKQPEKGPIASVELEKEFKEIKDMLVYRDVQERIADTIIEQLGQYSGFLNAANLDKYVLNAISSLITVGKFEANKTDKCRIVGFVGPTGVGKTTTIAKLAVLSKLIHGLDIALISIDTYRLGAIDQLRVFSEISDIDMAVAYDIPELQSLVEKYKNKNLIFIDTAGRSQNNTNLLKETKKYLNSIKADETFLVMSSTNTTRNLIDAAEKFRVFDYKGLVLTKLDEAAAFGNILNLNIHFNVPIYYMTNGQVIPDDILSADSEFIAKMVYTGKIYK